MLPALGNPWYIQFVALCVYYLYYFMAQVFTHLKIDKEYLCYVNYRLCYVNYIHERIRLL